MTTLSHISGLDVMVFDSVEQQYANTTLSIFGLFAAFANGFIIYGGYKNSKSTNTMLILMSLCYGDIILSSVTTVLATLNIIFGGWFGGKITCIISEITTESMSVLGLISMMLISFLNFIKIFKGVRLSDKITIMYVAAIWTLSIILSAAVYTLEGYQEYVYLGPSKTGCTVAWYNPAKSSMIISLVSLVIILWSLFLLVVVECIFLYNFYKYKNEKRQISGREVDSDEKNDSRRIEYKLVTKIVMLLVVYLVCWTPQVWFMLSSILFESPPGFQIDYFSKLCAIFKSLANPMLILFFDSSIRKRVFILVGLTTINSQPNTPSQTPKIVRAARKAAIDITSVKLDAKTDIIEGSRQSLATSLKPSSSNLSKVLEGMRIKGSESELEFNVPSTDSPGPSKKVRRQKTTAEANLDNISVPKSTLSAERISVNMGQAEKSPEDFCDDSKHTVGLITTALRSENQTQSRSRKNSNCSSVTKKFDPDEISVAPSHSSRPKRNRPNGESSTGKRPFDEQSVSSRLNLRLNRPTEENSFGKRPLGENSLGKVPTGENSLESSRFPSYNCLEITLDIHSPKNRTTNNGMSSSSIAPSLSPSFTNLNRVVSEIDDPPSPTYPFKGKSLVIDDTNQLKKKFEKEDEVNAKLANSGSECNIIEVNISSALHESQKHYTNTNSHEPISGRSSTSGEGGQKPRKRSPNNNDPRDNPEHREQIQMVPVKTMRIHGNLESSFGSPTASVPPSPSTPRSRASTSLRSGSRAHIGSSSQPGSRSNLSSRRNSFKVTSPVESKPEPLLMIEEKSIAPSVQESTKEQQQ